MYHRIGIGKHATALEHLTQQLRFFKEHYPIVLPGEPLAKKKLSLCLTFYDASFDFYYYLFPLLKQLGIRALLGVPVRYILEATTCSAQERLSVPYTLAMQDGIFDTKAPFCTWKELEEMVQSGYVEIASHSHMHCNLTFSFVDLQREIVFSKEILQERLKIPISTFIYPFGRWTPRVHTYVRQHYRYAFRIGSALNWSWGTGKYPLSRIIGDQCVDPAALISPFAFTRYFVKMLLDYLK